MKFVTDMSKGILGSPDSQQLWEEIIANIPDDVFLKPDVKILIVACGHCTEAVVIAKRMLALGVSKEAVNNSIYLIDKYQVFTNHAKLRYGFKNVITADFMEWKTDMKFDVIVGNPPYQDGNKSGQQNKLYNQFSRRSIELTAPNGFTALITPRSVLKKSIRFSLIGQKGLKRVDFTADNHFNVGVEICSWLIDNTYRGLVTVKTNNGEYTHDNKSAIYDYSKVDRDFAKLYTALRTVTKPTIKRMFMRNNFVDLAVKEDAEHQYPIYKIHKGSCILVKYSNLLPKFHNKLKFVVSMTKGFSESATIVNIKDYDATHVYTEVTNQDEIDNIKSFLFSDYFVAHSAKWKQVDGYGFNETLKYLPPFDKTKKWDNDSVKEFLESFVDE